MIGETLDSLADASSTPQRRRLTGTFAQALLWFTEGCRNRVHLGAIVNFMAALDALASGEREKGFRRLINARLGLENDQPLKRGGPPLQATIRELYSEGRSRTVHGTNDKLHHDWAEARNLAEQLARLCLVASLDVAAKAANDDPSILLRR